MEQDDHAIPETPRVGATTPSAAGGGNVVSGGASLVPGGIHQETVTAAPAKSGIAARSSGRLKNERVIGVHRTAKGTKVEQRLPTAEEIRAKSQEYWFGGYRVWFPFKAYPVQKQLMSKVIKCLDEGTLGLLESPTGTGKSLSLLCSALGWREGVAGGKVPSLERNSDGRSSRQSNVMKTPAPPASFTNGREKDLLAMYGARMEKRARKRAEVLALKEQQDEVAMATVNAYLQGGEDQPHLEYGHLLKEMSQRRMPKKVELRYDDDAHLYEDKDDEGEFKPLSGSLSVGKVKVDEGAGAILEGVKQEGGPGDAGVKQEGGVSGSGVEVKQEGAVAGGAGGAGGSVKGGRAMGKPPTVYVASRTHSQLSQLVRELRLTSYRPNMAVLGSRAKLCINSRVRSSGDIDQGCRDAVSERTCSQHLNYRKLVESDEMGAGGALEVWDIEDLIEAGRGMHACPFFASRDLAEKASLIFAPYNYLVEPLVRQAMNLTLSNSVVILDEAHNIEDVSRGGMSHEMTLDSLMASLSDCRRISETPGCESRQEHVMWGDLLGRVHKWATESQSAIKMTGSSGWESGERVWRDVPMVLEFVKHWGINPVNIEDYAAASKEIIAHVAAARQSRSRNQNGGNDGSSSKKEPELEAVASQTLRTIEMIEMVMSYVFYGKGEHVSDFSLVVKKEAAPRLANGEVPANPWVTTVCLWCMNPALAFRQLAGIVRSVVLTSGTLSPMTSFGSELGVKFGAQMEGGHVIPPDNVWIGVMKYGTNGKLLKGDFAGSQDLGYQDGVGSSILEVCRRTPDGVLVFFKSYPMMATLMSRWKKSGIWKQLQAVKNVVVEPRGPASSGGGGMRKGKRGRGRKATAGSVSSMLVERNDLTTMEGVMAEFLATLSTGRRRGEGGVTGSLMLGVFRGKVSEGMDFANEKGRAVICVGVPYPAVKAPDVRLKREFNNEVGRIRGLLSGGEWYSLQAYRALNQSLGRVIRNRNDYGAIILLGSTFAQKPVVGSISKWLRAPLLECDVQGNPKRMFHDAQMALDQLEGFFGRKRVEEEERVLLEQQEEADKETAAAAAAAAVLESRMEEEEEPIESAETPATGSDEVTLVKPEPIVVDLGRRMVMVDSSPDDAEEDGDEPMPAVPAPKTLLGCVACHAQLVDAGDELTIGPVHCTGQDGAVTVGHLSDGGEDDVLKVMGGGGEEITLSSVPGAVSKLLKKLMRKVGTAGKWDAAWLAMSGRSVNPSSQEVKSQVRGLNSVWKDWEGKPKYLELAMPSLACSEVWDPELGIAYRLVHCPACRDAWVGVELIGGRKTLMPEVRVWLDHIFISAMACELLQEAGDVAMTTVKLEGADEGPGSGGEGRARDGEGADEGPSPKRARTM